MTQTDFDRWFQDLTLRFPSVDGWLFRTFPEEPERVRLLRSWCGVLGDVALADALDINRQMQGGEAQWVGEVYEYSCEEHLPQYVRRLARRLAYEHRDRSREEPLPELKPTSFPAGQILRRILELTAKGMPREEAKAIVLAELPVGRPSYEPRYNCRLCLDVGDVIVASPSAIRAMLAGEFDNCHHRNAAVRCKCRAHVQQNPRRPIVIYDAAEDFLCHDSSWPQRQVEDFTIWCEAKRAEFWKSRRHHEFDEFNQREFS